MMDMRHTFRALRHRNYRLFFVGQSISLIGTWLQQVAMSWLAYQLTDSALFLGVVAFCSSISFLLFGTFAGVFADRVPRQKALLLTQGMMLLQATLLAVLVATDRIEVWHLIVLSLWLGTVSAFDMPLRQSMYVDLVPDRADLSNAIALNSFIVNIARVVGPALAGFLMAVTGEAVCFALNALSFAAVIVAIWRIDWPQVTPHPGDHAWWSSWKEGARYAFGFAPARKALILVAALAWTISPYPTLMPVFAKYVFGGGPETLGWLLSAAGAGALCSALHLANRKSVLGLGTTIALAALAAGIAMATFAFLRYLPAALLLMMFIGGGTVLAAAGTNIVMQSLVEDRMRGRIAGFYTMAFLGIAPLGNLAAGLLAREFGVPITFVANGILCVLAALWFWRQLPTMRIALRPQFERLGMTSDES